jgi:crotonobetainyl-CoA:carnitine CoA-transferase CaiB-like acyl-CoA transferase
LDLRVVEISQTAAAAFAGRLFADAGADVILVEPPQGHPLRREGPFKDDRADPETSAAHLHINAGKRSLIIEPAAEGALVRKLLGTADVFLTDVRAAVLDPLGLGWSALHAEQPGLLMTRVTPFGETGPYRSYESTNLISMALGGQLKITGDPGAPPLCNYGSQALYQGGLAAFAGTLANLLLGDATGEGEYLDLSVQDVVANNLEGRSLTFNLGVMAERAGLNVSAVYGVYPCADGWVFISAFAPALWEQLKEAAQIAELHDDRFSTQAGRLEHNDELQAIIIAWTLSKTSDELRAFAQRGYPLTVSETPERLLDSEQWRTRGVAHLSAHPAAGTVTIVGPAWLSADRRAAAPAPLLGADTAEILAGLSQAVV